MPELPEVQTIVDDLNQSNITDCSILRIRVNWRRTVAEASDSYLRKNLLNKNIKNIYRRGKWIVMVVEDVQVLIHLRMSGRIQYERVEEKASKYVRFALQLDNGCEIRFHDPRKFGRVYVGKYAEGRLEKLGLEPLEDQFKVDGFYGELQSHKRMIKPFLLDQSIVAGLGNIYVDEALWKSKIHPERLSNSISLDETKELFKAIRWALKRGLKNLGTSLGHSVQNFVSVAKQEGKNQMKLKAYGRGGEECERCRGIIEKTVVGQRGTHFCKECQKN